MNASRLGLLLLPLSLAACGGDAGKTESPATEATAPAGTTPGAAASAVSFADVPVSPAYPGATLRLDGVTAAPAGTDSAKLSFRFAVKGFDLKAQTGDADQKMCNNSAQGQHVHFILDNKPYVALYEPKHETTVARNSEHYVLCFLSRSYHESVKGKDAAVMVHFKVDGDGKLQMLEAPKEPVLFYSRPKGDYLGKDTTNLLLDFYVWNGAVSDALRVVADVENTTTGAKGSYTFTEWKPKFVTGLGTGTAKVTLRMTDKSGATVAGPQSTVTRENIRLAASEPMK